MRICFISRGDFVHVRYYIDHFLDAGHEVHFLPLTVARDSRAIVHQLDVCPCCSPMAGKPWRYGISMIRARRLLRRLRPDIVSTHYATSGGIAALYCGFHPTILTAHGSDLTVGIESVVWRHVLTKILGFCDHVRVVSDDLARMAIELGVTPDKISTRTHGIDTDLFAYSRLHTDILPSPLRLVCTRAFEAHYDHRTIAKALVRLQSAGVDCTATFVGDGSTRPEIMAMVKEWGLGGRTDFVGRVANHDLPRVLAEHDVYVSASIRDGTSLSLLEAMSVGLFPVVSRIPANEAWIQDGLGGALFAVGDAMGLAERIQEVAEGRVAIANTLQHNREKVVRRADRRANLAEFERIAERLVRARCA